MGGDVGGPRRVLILGAGGRDFHLFNTCYRDDSSVRVVAFTAAQIPHIDDRRYPPVLAGDRYPEGIPIHAESELERWLRSERVDEAVFAYSDVSLAAVDTIRRRVVATGAAFSTYDPQESLLATKKACIAVCAVRTGCGKSPVSRHLASALRQRGCRVAVLRHPMPYGQLEKQVVQRFAEEEDLDRHHCTVEEVEEYEPHLRAGGVVFAGADYERILAEAEKECDVVLWDGGNNDAPFIRPDVLVTLLDPLRAGDELRYFPSQWNLEHADVLLIAKSEQASQAQIGTVIESAETFNPSAILLEGLSPIEIENVERVRGKRVLVIEDGPTTTHGGMGYGAGWLAACAAGAEIVDPRPSAVGEIAAAFAKYPHLEKVLPALGYGDQQLADLEATINAVDCEAVVIGTPIDLARIIRIEQPACRVTYRYADRDRPGLADIVWQKLVALREGPWSKAVGPP